METEQSEDFLETVERFIETDKLPEDQWRRFSEVYMEQLIAQLRAERHNVEILKSQNSKAVRLIEEFEKTFKEM